MNINVANGYRSAQRRIVNHRSRVSSLHGFTLIELMIVIAVLAIVMTVAIASYSNYSVKARRGAAKGCLAESAQFMERYYTLNLRYDQDTGGTAVAIPVLQCENELEDHYIIALDDVDATSFTLSATPIGAQLAGDALCGVMTLDNTGTKTTGGTDSVQECW